MSPIDPKTDINEYEFYEMIDKHFKLSIYFGVGARIHLNEIDNIKFSVNYVYDIINCLEYLITHTANPQ